MAIGSAGEGSAPNTTELRQLRLRRYQLSVVVSRRACARLKSSAAV